MKITSRAPSPLPTFTQVVYMTWRDSALAKLLLAKDFTAFVTTIAYLVYNYPTRACVKGLSNSFCPSVRLSVCQLVSQVKKI